jgi:hypothetical protein
MNDSDTRLASRRLSRETRNLLIAACVSLLALWGLARLRFPDRPAVVNPISPVLTQLSAPPVFAELAAEVVRVRTRLGEALVAVEVATESPWNVAYRPALRIRPDAAAVLLQAGEPEALASRLLAFDPATALALVQVQRSATAPPVVPWIPARAESPRYVMMTTASRAGVALQPLFVSALTSVPTPAWSGPLYLMPRGADIPPGALLFSVEGELVGMAVVEGDRVAIVPGDILLADAQRVQARGIEPAGVLGVSVQALDARVSAATGAEAGVVVTWVAAGGPAGGLLRPGDVIERMNGVTVSAPRDWDVRANRLATGEAVVLDIRRAGDVSQVQVTTAADVPGERPGLGLLLRFITNVGAEIVRLEPKSAAADAGLRLGDVITVFGDSPQPTPARIRQLFAGADEGVSILVAFTRGDSHHVTAIER